MKVVLSENSRELGKRAAEHAAKRIAEAIAEKGKATILLSTGASQFTFFEHIRTLPVEWNKVEVFHLDEYVGISPEHSASFNHYIKTRFVDFVHPGTVHLIDGTRPAEETIKQLTALLEKSPVDLGMIGIGENAHIAFNDPPADFDDDRAYKVVNLADRCLAQQVNEGWFKNKEEAYKQAISMTCKKIMQCKTIISAVPYACKAEAIQKTLSEEVNANTPATLLKTHSDCTVYVDKDSASLVPKEILRKFL